MRESTRRDVFMPFLPLLVHTLSRGVHIWIESTCMALMYSVRYDIQSAWVAYFMLHAVRSESDMGSRMACLRRMKTVFRPLAETHSYLLVRIYARILSWKRQQSILRLWDQNAPVINWRQSDKIPQACIQELTNRDLYNLHYLKYFLRLDWKINELTNYTTTSINLVPLSSGQNNSFFKILLIIYQPKRCQ
jgi:hypothetical protein